MRLATVRLDDGAPVAALVAGGSVLPVTDADWPAVSSIRAIAAGGAAGLERLRAWASLQPDAAWRRLGEVSLGPVVPDPGAVYTVGYNYRAAGEPPGGGPDRPMVFAKAASSVAGHGAVLAWDRLVAPTVDAECELGVVIGREAFGIRPEEALGHVLGYTIINDVTSRDPWLDGDQFLLGKSMPGFCPVGPWLVTPDELDPADLGLGCTINGEPIQEGRTSAMRFGVAEVVAYLARHATLRPGDLIATGTPARLAAPPGPDRHLRPGDVVACGIEGIGELVTTVG